MSNQTLEARVAELEARVARLLETQADRQVAAATLGRIKTPNKAKTSRANGAKGGRPRKPRDVVK